VNYADSSFVVSLFLRDVNQPAALSAAAANPPFALTPLLRLEARNAFNLGVNQKRMTIGQRDTLWRAFEQAIADGFFTEETIPAADLHDKAHELSDRYTPKLATRSLDLLHVAAALLLGAKTFYSFDERQRQAAAGEGLKVKP
jgi:predicted nucleic acid-binding protein